jgi:hypothetical protein
MKEKGFILLADLLLTMLCMSIICALVILLFVGGMCQAQVHEHQVQPMNQGIASILDAQRHALLHAAEFDAAGIQSGFPDAFVSEAKLFKAEFTSEIENFNNQQQLRDSVSAKQAMDNFYAWRDSIVGNHWVAAEAKMSKLEVAWIESSLMGQMRVPPERKVASLGPQFPPNNGTSSGCGPDVTCIITYSLAMASNSTSSPAVQEKFSQSSGQWYLESDSTEAYGLIIDGGTTMNCPPACNSHPTHRPNVQLVYNGTNYTAQGNGTCGNCYIYASGAWSFTTNWSTEPGRSSPPIEISDGGSILCTVAGIFLTAGEYH